MSNKPAETATGVARGILIALGVIAALGLLYVAAVVVFFLFVGGGEWG